MANISDLPPDSKAYAELAFREKEALRKRRARMSFKRKLEMLDRLREEGKWLQKREG
ncbi:MAG: hypothetical protein HY532_08250 [Chloroflexi bacterium]|nr:hypothetical protein [Chloroflexota bacterium]